MSGTEFLSLPSWPRERFDVAPDFDLLKFLIADLEEHGGDLAPSSAWTIDHKSYDTIDTMLAPWCGKVGMQLLSEPELIKKITGKSKFLSERFEFVKDLDYIGALAHRTVDDLAELDWRVFDLTSLVDFLMINAFHPFSTHNGYILEIGGGFGRIAEFLTALDRFDFKYINVDAVPNSLMFCYQFLKHRFPDKKTKIIPLDTSEIDEEADFLVVPSWHSRSLSDAQCDLAINIESFQEMSQSTVDYYYNFIDRHCRTGAHIYTVNSRIYKFKGEWNIPNRWDLLFKHTTQRSWTMDHPTELFVRTEQDCTPRRRLREHIYARELQTRQALKDAK